MSLKTKLVTLLLVLTIGPLLLIGFLNYQSTKEGVKNLAVMDLKYFTALNAETINPYTKDQTLTEDDMKNIKTYVGNIQKNYYEKNGMMGYGYILDEEGILVVHPKDEGKNVSSLAFVQDMLAQKNGYIEYTYDGMKKVVSFRELPNGWIFAIGTGYEELVKPANEVVSKTVIITIIASLVSAIVGIVFVLRITNVLEKMMNTFRKVADGDLTTHLEVHRKDELGVMAKVLNEMTENLKSFSTKLQGTSKQLTSSAALLDKTTTTQKESTKQLANSSFDMAKGVDAQLVNSQEINRSMQEISTSIEHLATSTSDLSSNSSHATEQAKEGVTSIEFAISLTEKIQLSVKSFQGVLSGLENRTSEIGDIVDLITGINDQTNLLALNAAIEAARAGEHGKGFAVVADEVRKLAEQSGQSAAKISSLVGAIQKDMTNVVSSMKGIHESVDSGTEAMKSAGIKFEEILQSNEKISTDLEETSSLSEEMAAGVEEVSASMEEVTSVANETAAFAQNVASQTEVQSHSIEEVAKSIHELMLLANEVNELLQHFRGTEPQ